MSSLHLSLHHFCLFVGGQFGLIKNRTWETLVSSGVQGKEEVHDPICGSEEHREMPKGKGHDRG